MIMMSKNPIFLSIAEVSERVRTGDVSPVELVERSLDRIGRLDERLNAFVAVVPERAREAARRAEAEIRSGEYRGPLHGIPIGVKDIIDAEGIATTQGSIIFKDNIPGRDAAVVARLKEAGAIVLGKTNTHEFAFGVTTNNPHYGPTRNPWNLSLIPGGSSGGSAAATAAHLCFAALGSDTGGSIRIPAAFCGLIGLKPTYGRVSLRGVFPLATGFDHVGPLTRTAADAAILLGCMAGLDQGDPRSLMAPVPSYRDELEGGIEGARIGVPSELSQITLDAEIEGALKAAASAVENLGGEVIEESMESADRVEGVSTSLVIAEALAQHAELLATHPEKYGSDVRDRLRDGQRITMGQYIRGLRSREEIVREVEMAFEEVDFLLTPTVQIRPPEIGRETVILGSEELNIIRGCTRFTRLGNLTGMPAIAVPFGYDPDSVPLSVMFMAPRLREAELLRLAAALEEATPELRNRIPPL